MAQSVHFTGSGNASFDDFISQFRTVAAINRWQECDLALIMGAYLQGPALAYFKFIYKDDLDFKNLCDLMRKEFPTKIDYVEKFYNSRQGKDEDIISFFYNLSHLSQKANITDEKIFIKIFLKGITADYKLKLGARIYSSKAELQATLDQIKEIFEDVQHESLNLPLQPRGILTKVRIEHPLEVNQSLPTSVRPTTPLPSSSHNTPHNTSTDQRDSETYHTPRYNLRPRYPYTYRNNRSPIIPSTRNPPPTSNRPNHPNYTGHRR